MPRLFTAIWLPPPVLAELSAELSGEPTPGPDPGRTAWPPQGWRAIPTRRWHLTVCFHGEADPGVLARRLEAGISGCGPDGARAPRLRLAGQVSFPGVIAAAVTTGARADHDALSALVAAAGADPATYRPHVTVARTSRRGDRPPAGGPLHRFTGRWWRPAEICLVRSEQVSGAPRYTTLHRVPLTHVSDHVVKPGTAGW